MIQFSGILQFLVLEFHFNCIPPQVFRDDNGHIYNFGQNIWRLFHVLAQFLFTTNETQMDYCHLKVNVQVASRVAERLRILGNFKKILAMHAFDGKSGVEIMGQKFSGHSTSLFSHKEFFPACLFVCL